MPETKKLPSLSKPMIDIDSTETFCGDAFGRKELAVQLTSYIDRLRDGAVLAIDAPWGDGKTWFGKNWKQQLETENRKVIYIDAFEQDYTEDPFMLLASEFMGIVDDTEENIEVNKYKEKAINVAKTTMSIGAKISIGLATKYLLGGVDLSKEIEDSIQSAGDELGNISSKLIEKKFDEYKTNKETFISFKDELKKISEKQDKPIVIFIDELDRCKPDFAVGLVERIKHFFDIPNIVFVLLINREQLENAIKGIYGSDTNASSYLGKFINFFFELPKPKLNYTKSEYYYRGYINSQFDAYKFPITISSSTTQFLAGLVPVFGLSLRDIEKIIGLYAFAYDEQIQNQSYPSDFLLYVIVLKTKDYILFNKLLEGDKEAHKTVKDKILVHSENSYTFLQILGEWHQAYIDDFVDIGEKIQRLFDMINNIFVYDLKFKDMMPWFAKKIELQITK